MEKLVYKNSNQENLVRGVSQLPRNFPNNNNFSTGKPEPTETIHYLNINSNSREFINYPKHYSYKVRLLRQYKNVIKAELVNAIIPNNTGINLEPYLILDINELNDVNFQVENNSLDGFSILPILETTNNFIVPELIRTPTYFSNKKDITFLTVNLLDSNGTLYTFGNETGTKNKEFQHSFTIKLTCSI